MTETEETTNVTSSPISISTTTTTDIANNSQMEKNNREISSPPVSSSASVALSYLKQPMVVREAAAAAAAEASNKNPNTPPLDLTKEEDFTKIDQSSTNKNNGVFTNDSSADLMVGCSGPLTPPTNTDDNVADTTIMPHPVAQQFSPSSNGGSPQDRSLSTIEGTTATQITHQSQPFSPETMAPLSPLDGSGNNSSQINNIGGHFSSDQMIRAVANLSPPHAYYNGNGTGRPYSENLGAGNASPASIATQTLTEINAMPSYGEDVSGSPIYGQDINGSQLGGDIYAVPTIQSNILGEVVSATIGGGMENETGGNVVPLGGMRMDTWPYDSPVTTDFHLDDSNWDSKPLSMGQGLRAGSNCQQSSPHIQPHPIASPFMSSCGGLGQGINVGAPWQASVSCSNSFGIGDSNHSNDGSGFPAMTGYEEFPHNQVSPTNVSSNQSQILRPCGVGMPQQHNQQFMNNRPGSNGNTQQNNNSIQQPAIPKVQQLDGYNAAQNSSVTSTNCSISSTSLPLNTMNDIHAQQQSSNIFVTASKSQPQVDRQNSYGGLGYFRDLDGGSSSQLNGMPNPMAHPWLKPCVQNLSSGNSGGPINLLTNGRSSQEIPEIITGNKLSTNDTEKKLKANMAIVQANCISKSLQNSKAQSNVGSGEPQPPPRRQGRSNARLGPHTICSNCKTQTTSLWRRNIQGQIVCNACGLYVKLHKKDRPLDMRKDIVRTRNRKEEGTSNSAKARRRLRDQLLAKGAYTKVNRGARLSPSTTCANCNTSKTSLWRRNSQSQAVCNACGLYVKLHGKERPVQMRKDVIQSRKRKQAGVSSSAKARRRQAEERNRLEQLQNEVSHPNGLQHRNEYTNQNVSPGMAQTSDLHASFLSSIGNNVGQAVVAVSMNDENASIGSYSVLNSGSVNVAAGGGISSMGGGIIHSQSHKVPKGTLEFPNAQSYLSFASTDPPLSAINPTNSGITTPLSTLVAVAGKTSNKKRSPTSKNFPYLHFHEPKQETNNGIHQTGSYSHINEPKTPQRQIYSPFIQQPGGTFDPKSIDFSALQLPNTPPKTSRNKKNLHKTTSSSSPLSLASSSIVHTQIHQ